MREWSLTTRIKSGLPEIRVARNQLSRSLSKCGQPYAVDLFFILKHKIE